MSSVYKDILDSKAKNEKLLAVLIDPDKFSLGNASSFIEKVNQSIATHIFIGGSIVSDGKTDQLVSEIKKHTNLPIVLFPGDISQITNKADALLFLSLISGRNPDYLIGKHVEAVSKLKSTRLEIISTGYILIESGKETAIEKVTNTKPIARKNIQKIVDSSIAGQHLGMKLMYLEAGSGATEPISVDIINNVKQELNVPLIVGGGIRSKAELENAFNAGADIVVIGTALELDESFFDALKKDKI